MKAARAMTPEGLRATLKDGFQEFSIQMGLQGVKALFEEDADALCGGPKGKHLGSERKAWRHGYETGYVRLGFARLPVLRPRVRSALGKGEELELPSYTMTHQEGFSLEQVEAACLAGVSQRGYEAVAKEFTGGPSADELKGLSKSVVGRRFIGATRRQLKSLEHLRLDGKRPLVLYIDGLVLGDFMALSALIVYDDGSKVFAGLQEGSTENGELCQEFLQKLVARGLSTEEGLLVVLDGGKGLAAGVKAVLGSRAVIQRCRVHKKRNILEKLPKALQESVGRRLLSLWAVDDEGQAESGLKALADELEQSGHADAAGSLREGLSDTLACQRLGLPADARLTKSVSNTNIIESAYSTHERVSHRVRHWKNGDMAMRWVGAALLVAQKSFKKVGTELELAQLGRALQAHVHRQKAPAEEAA